MFIKINIYYLTIKYWLQGFTWKFAKEWERSAGTRAEVKIAEEIGLPIYEVYDDSSKKC